MQQRQLLYLIGALAILLFVAFLSGTFDNEISTIDVPELSIAGDDIEQITISGSDSISIVLAKQQTGWVLTEPLSAQADSIMLSRLTENIGSLEIESVVSTNPDKYRDFGVGTDGQMVTITTKKGEHTLFLGNPGPDFQSMYIRMLEDPRIFLSQGRVNVPSTLDTWRDKTVTNVLPSSIRSVTVMSPAETYQVSLGASNWSLNSNGQSQATDSLDVMNWLKRFSPLKGTGFSESIDLATIQDSATHKILFTHAGGEEKTLWILESDTEALAATSEQSSIYRLTKSMVSMYAPASSTLATE